MRRDPGAAEGAYSNPEPTPARPVPRRHPPCGIRKPSRGCATTRGPQALDPSDVQTEALPVLVTLALVGAVCAVLYPSLEAAFLANWGFNSLILGVLLLGVIINFQQVLALEVEIEWIKLFRTGQTGISLAVEPRLLRPLASHLSGRMKDRFRLSAHALRTILDGMRSRATWSGC
jgi:hypothetical protein